MNMRERFLELAEKANSHDGSMFVCLELKHEPQICQWFEDHFMPNDEERQRWGMCYGAWLSTVGIPNDWRGDNQFRALVLCMAAAAAA